jgi:RecG-like helicase
LIKPFLGRLGFRLTEAQSGVLREIRQDMARCESDAAVGAGGRGVGKTVVAAAAALMVD